MGLHYEIDSAAARVTITGSGKLSMPAMIAVVEDVAVDSRFNPDFIVIFDIRDADYTAELSDGDAFAAALRRREEAFQKRFALVVPESLHVLATLYCVVAKVAGVDRMRSFTEKAKAEAWCREGAT